MPADMATILDQIRADLTAPRRVTPFVLAAVYKYAEEPGDPTAEYFAATIPKFEDYELDDIFSPLFTPDTGDMARYSPLLRDGPAPATEDVAAAIEAIGAEELVTTLEIDDGETYSLPVDEMYVERYVKLLRLPFAPDSDLADRVARSVPLDDVDVALASCRSAAWESQPRREFLQSYLDAATSRGPISVFRLDYLGEFVRPRTSLDLDELKERMKERIVSIEEALRDAGGPKPFFHPQIQDWHGGHRDQRNETTDKRLGEHQEELDLAQAVAEDLSLMAAAR